MLTRVVKGRFSAASAKLAAAAVGLCIAASIASAAPFPVIALGSTVVTGPGIKLAPTPELLDKKSINNVRARAPHREGSDAIALGLIGSFPQGEWPYYGYADYYGRGDYYTPYVPWCERQVRCQD